MGARGPKPGTPKTPGSGRQKGVPNRLTADVKSMVLQALQEAHPKGGVEYLKRQANENPAAFMTLIGKVIPLQVAGDPEGAPVSVVHKIVLSGPDSA